MGTVKSKETCSEKPSETGAGHRKKFSVTKRLSLKSSKQEYNVETTNSYIVRYVGKTVRKSPGGEGIDACIRDMFDKVHKRQNELPRVCLTITPRDMTMRQISATSADNNETLLIPFSRISFVVADKKHQLFAFNDFVSQKPRKIECHVFICSEGESSDTISSALQGAFGAVYSESTRKMSRSSEQENMSYSEKKDFRAASVV